jgi:hypothetical protein
MSEFSNRVEAQRVVLRTINEASWKEELFGLSRGAIERWASSNGLSRDSKLVELSLKAAGELASLAAHSDSPIAAEYRFASLRLKDLTNELRTQLQTSRHKA